MLREDDKQRIEAEERYREDVRRKLATMPPPLPVAPMPRPRVEPLPVQRPLRKPITSPWKIIVLFALVGVLVLLMLVNANPSDSAGRPLTITSTVTTPKPEPPTPRRPIGARHDQSP